METNSQEGKPDFPQWIETESGKIANDLLTLKEQKYLTHRLYWAFDAGRDCGWSQYLKIKEERDSLQSELSSLREENERLMREENKRLSIEMDKAYGLMRDYTRRSDEKSEEISRLKSENKRLKNDILDLHDVKSGNGPTALSNVIHENKQLKEERDLLKAEVEKWHNQSDANEQCWAETVKDYNRVLELNKELKAENDEINNELNDLVTQFHTQTNQILDLKAENERLKGILKIKSLLTEPADPKCDC